MSSKLSGHLFLRDSQDHLIVSSCPKLKSASWDAESSTKTSEAKLTYQKIFGLIQVGRSGLGSSKHLVILNKKSHACRSLISSISKELSEEETTLRACKLQLQCSGPCGRVILKKTYLGSQYLQCHLTYSLLVLQQHMFFHLLVIYCGGTYLKSPAFYVKRSIVHLHTFQEPKKSPSSKVVSPSNMTLFF